MAAERLTTLQEIIERVFRHEFRVPIFEYSRDLFHRVFNVEFGVFVQFESCRVFVERADAFLRLEEFGFDGPFLLHFLLLFLLLPPSARPLHFRGTVLRVHYLEPKYIKVDRLSAYKYRAHRNTLESTETYKITSVFEPMSVIMTFDMFLSIEAREKRFVTVEARSISVDGDVREKESASMALDQL